MALVLVFELSGSGIVLAQTNSTATPSAPSQNGGRLSFLSPQDKMKLLKARKEVLAANPDLQAEQQDLMKQREALKDNADATPEDKMELFQSFTAHEKKMQAAMLKVDPTLAPVFAQIDQQMKQKMAQRAASAGGGGN